MKIADKIKLLRTVSGITQLELAKIAGVSDKAVSTWENGIKEPRMSSLAKICAHFDLDLNSFADENTGDAFLTKAIRKLPPFPRAQLSFNEEKLLSLYSELNQEGQEKLIDFADDLVRSGKYKKNNPICLANGKT